MDGIERIKVLASEIKDEAVLEIVNHLISREDMNEKYLNDEKSLKQMLDFIRDNARKLAKNDMAMVKDLTVFNWAIHYWDETNEVLGLNKKETKINKVKELTEEEQEEKTPKIKEIVPVNEDKKQWIPEGQLSLF